MNQRARCPNPVCPQPDDVQKVSVVNQGANALNIGHGVAWQLEAPTPPSNAGRWGCVSVPLLIISIPIALVGVLGFITGLAMVLGVIPPNNNPNNWPPSVELFVGLAYTVVFGLIAVGIVLSKRKGAAAWKHDYPAWRTASAKWDQLYYCNRCGSVFNPDDGDRFVPAPRMKELLV